MTGTPPTWEELEALLAEAIARLPADLRERTPPPASAADWAVVEARLERPVPPVLQRWWSLCGGGFEPEIVIPLSPAEAAEMLAADAESDPRFLPLGWQGNGWCPIAVDGCGNYFLVDCAASFGPGEPVFFVDMIADRNRPTYLAASDCLHLFVGALREELGREEAWDWFERADVARHDPTLLNFRGVPFGWDDE